MKLYIAGAYADRERVLRAMSAARTEGHEIVHDWVSIIDRVRVEGGQRDCDLDRAEALRHCVGDIRAIRGADVFWLLSPPAGQGRGCWVELGIAYQMGVHIFVSGETARDTVFTALGWRYRHDSDVLRELERMDRETDPPRDEGRRGSSA